MEIIRLLLENGANITPHDGHVLCETVQDGYPDTSVKLIEYGLNVDISLLQAAIYRGDMGIVRLLLEKRLGVNTLQGSPWALSTLIRAIREDRADVVGLFIELGLDIDVEDDSVLQRE